MKTKQTYNVGDRVAERPKTHGLMTVRAEVRDRIAQYRSQRYGTVVGFSEKITTRGSKQKMLRILWDHLQTPTEHAQMRICHERDLTTMIKNVLVPGE
jgi:hypothetical protein